MIHFPQAKWLAAPAVAEISIGPKDCRELLRVLPNISLMLSK